MSHRASIYAEAADVFSYTAQGIITLRRVFFCAEQTNERNEQSVRFHSLPTKRGKPVENGG